MKTNFIKYEKSYWHHTHIFWKCGLEQDLRPFSEFTQVWTILSLTTSKIDFGGCHWLTGNSIGDKFPSTLNFQSINNSLQNPKCTKEVIDIIVSDSIWHCYPKSILEAVNDKNDPNPCQFWEWPQITFDGGHTCLIWKNFSENVDRIPIKIWFLMHFVFTRNNYSQMAHFRCLKT